MDKMAQGLLQVCSALQGLSVAVVAIALIIAGISAIKNGADGRMKLKDDLTYTIVGAAIVLLATTLAKSITGWFQ